MRYKFNRSTLPTLARWQSGITRVLHAIAGGASRLALTMIRRLLTILNFPVLIVADNVWPTYFLVVGASFVFALLALALDRGTTFTFGLLPLSLAALCLGVLYHLLRHRWFTQVSLGLALLAITGGGFLLTVRSPQHQLYNEGLALHKRFEWEEGNKRFEESIAAYHSRPRGQLWQIILGPPDNDLAALAHFHRSTGLQQLPGTANQPYLELCKSLALNPGNIHFGKWTAADCARLDNDADHAQRNLDKLIRDKRDGGAGQPRGKPGNAAPKKEQKEKRQPGKEPKPGSGRAPRNTL